MTFPRALHCAGLAYLAAAAASVGVSCRKPEPVAPAQDRAAFTFPRSAPIPRKDAFFGLHFDLHPQATDTALGADISEDNIRSLLERVRPDFVQYDCKGHAGWAGYPTAVGWPSPGIVKDSLAVWRKATRDVGVGLFIHYSGVWDSQAVAEHPGWARIDANGRRDPNATSVFGPYVDELLIPQLNEVAQKYGLDGVWADGECWAAQLDWSPRALAAWTKETGYRDAPKDRTDSRWLAWKGFHRRAFERYLAHWIDAVHAANPGLQLTSNWMYTTFAPKPVEAKLDFLSGDYSPSLSVDRARVEARYLASTGMPWDLMAWGFDKGKDLAWSIKPVEHLMQEASVVLMQGGGFQIYHTPTRSGYLVEPIIAQEEAVAAFCRARQAVSHKSKSEPQVALLLSSESFWDRSDAVFAPWGDVFQDLEGALHALLNLHYSVDILAEHQLQPRLDEYPLVVVPDSHRLTAEFRRALTDYVEQGGSLLLLGEKSARLFEPLLGVEIEGAPAQRTAELASAGGVTNADGVWQKIKPKTARAAGFIHPTRDVRTGGEVAATVNAFGKGKVGAVYGPVASIYFRSHHPWLRDFIGGLASELFPDPAVTVDGPPTLDIALRRTPDGRLSVHLLNTAGMPLPDRYGFTDFIPPLEGIILTIRTEARPRSVAWVPDGGRLEWSWAEGRLKVAVPKLKIHGAVVWE
ncbi:MAG: beta-galactosidase trimerization domain-containing protein [Candidatus Aminicenantes bacterium]|nr:beta-galactosidase trimerization domain-containing protein [Candidatus Aminicenantes bacterium]